MHIVCSYFNLSIRIDILFLALLFEKIWCFLSYRILVLRNNLVSQTARSLNIQRGTKFQRPIEMLFPVANAFLHIRRFISEMTEENEFCVQRAF